MKKFKSKKTNFEKYKLCGIRDRIRMCIRYKNIDDIVARTEGIIIGLYASNIITTSSMDRLMRLTNKILNKEIISFKTQIHQKCH